MMGWYLGSAVGSQAEAELSEQFGLHLQMCVDRLDSAVQASRLASYDTTIREAWHAYRADGNYAALYRETRGFLNRQYQADSRFLYGVFCFSEDPQEMQLITINSALGAMLSLIHILFPFRAITFIDTQAAITPKQISGFSVGASEIIVHNLQFRFCEDVYILSLIHI